MSPMPARASNREIAHRVLVADSHLGRAEKLAVACREVGLDVEVAPNGALALEHALQKTPALIVGELDLPLVSARKLAEILRANPRTHGVRFIYLGPENPSQPLFEVGDTLIPVSSSREAVLAVVQEQLLRCQHVAELEEASQSEGIVTGELQNLPLADLLQVAHLSRKSGRFELERVGDGETLGLEGEAPTENGERGLVVVRDGDILLAQTSPVEGEKALFRMLAWREGSFRFTARRDPEAPAKIAAPVRALLSEGLRQLAEWDRLALRLPPLSSTVTLAVETKDLPHIVHPLTQEVLLALEHCDRVRDVVDRCAYPDYQVLRTLQTLTTRNMVVLGAGPVRGLTPREDGSALFSDAQLRCLRDHLASGTPRGGRIASGKLLVVPEGADVLTDWLRLLHTLPEFEAAPGFGRGATPREELGPLGLLRLDSELEIELVQIPAGEAYQPLRGLAGHGALASLHLHAGGVPERALEKTAAIDAETGLPGLHVVLLSAKQKLDAAALQDPMSALDDASLFLMPLPRGPMDREPVELLRNLLARIVP